MDMTISLRELLFVILFIALIAAVVYLIITLKNISTAVKSVTLLVDSNSANLTEIIDSLPKIAKNLKETTDKAPEIMENINSVVSDVRGSVDTVTDTVDVVGAAVSKTTLDITEKADIVTQYISLGAEIVRSIIEALKK